MKDQSKIDFADSQETERKEGQSQPHSDADERARRFEAQAEAPEIGFWEDFWLFLRKSKKWWLLPLLASLLLVGAISILSASGAAPFIYTIF